jgi:hypothetical protein
MFVSVFKNRNRAASFGYTEAFFFSSKAVGVLVRNEFALCMPEICIFANKFYCLLAEKPPHIFYQTAVVDL